MAKTIKQSGLKLRRSRQHSSNKLRLKEKGLEKIVKRMESKMVKMRAKNARMRKLEKKSKVMLKKIEKQCDQWKKVRKQLLDKGDWAQTCTDVMQGIFNADDEGDFVTADLLTCFLRELMML